MAVSFPKELIGICPANLKEDDIGGLFIVDPTAHFCRECKKHFPVDLVIENIKQVAVQLIDLTEFQAEFQRMDGSRFTHQDNSGWIRIRAVWSRVLPSRSIRPVFDIHQFLTEADVGKAVVRSQPYDGDRSWIPPGVTRWDERFALIDPAVFSGFTSDGQWITLKGREKKFPNDGYWIPFEEFFRCIRQSPLRETPVQFESFSPWLC